VLAVSKTRLAKAGIGCNAVCYSGAARCMSKATQLEPYVRVEYLHYERPVGEIAGQYLVKVARETSETLPRAGAFGVECVPSCLDPLPDQVGAVLYGGPTRVRRCLRSLRSRLHLGRAVSVSGRCLRSLRSGLRKQRVRGCRRSGLGLGFQLRLSVSDGFTIRCTCAQQAPESDEDADYLCSAPPPGPCLSGVVFLLSCCESSFVASAAV